uniref:kelch-like protein 20 n=1 Tax=Ciona intestinalis TaxID=7719 RepID=UPI000180BEB2|nr:kelch-like protein 20 [Ciona intestinalis]|eukprot:XP_002131570.1 kelch-like protein 20 [Ciona intestinalis]
MVMELPTEIDIETDEVLFESNHAEFLLQELNKDRVGGQELCDVRFCVGKMEIPAHKSVLGSFSNYYKKMFALEVREKYETDIATFGITGATLQAIIDFVYTGRIQISRENVYDVFVASDYLSITPVRDFCIRFLKDSILVSNCVSMRQLGLTHNSNELVEATEHFMAVNFNAVTKQAEFKQLNVNDVTAILKLRVSSNEGFILTAVLNWVKHNTEARQQYFQQLFDLVNLKKLSTSFLNTLVAEDLVKTSQSCLVKIVQQYSGRSMQQKTPTEFIVFGNKTKTKGVQTYNVQTQVWSDLPETRKERIGACGAFFDKKVYALGAAWSNSVECLSLKNLNLGWQSLTPMNKNRQFAASVVTDGNICVSGGHNNGGKLKSVELYSIKNDTWGMLPNMNFHRSGHAMHCVDGILYSVGRVGLVSTERFDPRENKWTLVADMHSTRDGMASAVCQDGIFTLGGLRLRTVERFDPRNNKWLELASMVHPRAYGAACNLDGNIYIVGGMGSEQSASTVEMYDSAKDAWKVSCTMPSAKACSVVLALG